MQGQRPASKGAEALGTHRVAFLGRIGERQAQGEFQLLVGRSQSAALNVRSRADAASARAGSAGTGMSRERPRRAPRTRTFRRATASCGGVSVTDPGKCSP